MDLIPRNVQERTRHLQERMKPQIDQVRDNLVSANREAARFIRERPAVALLGALALGFVVGRIVSRA